jgi:hypothetical protein
MNVAPHTGCLSLAVPCPQLDCIGIMTEATAEAAATAKIARNLISREVAPRSEPERVSPTPTKAAYGDWRDEYPNLYPPEDAPKS